MHQINCTNSQTDAFGTKFNFGFHHLKHHLDLLSKKLTEHLKKKITEDGDTAGTISTSFTSQLGEHSTVKA
jgi:hypothetical protein